MRTLVNTTERLNDDHSTRPGENRRAGDHLRANGAAGLRGRRVGVLPDSGNNGRKDAGAAAPAAALEALAAELAQSIAERLAGILAELVTTPPEPERPLDRRGLARYLGCSVDTVDRLRREGLPRLRVGDSERYEREVVLEWLRDREGRP